MATSKYDASTGKTIYYDSGGNISGVGYATAEQAKANGVTDGSLYRAVSTSDSNYGATQSAANQMFSGASGSTSVKTSTPTVSSGSSVSSSGSGSTFNYNPLNYNNYNSYVGTNGTPTQQVKISNNYAPSSADEGGLGPGGQVYGYTFDNGTGYSYGNTGADKVTQTGTGMKDWTSAGTGATGKTYMVSNTNNSIQVQYKDGSVRTVTPGMPDYNNTVAAMQVDLQSNGVKYVPTRTTERDVPTYELTNNGLVQNGTDHMQYQMVNYLMGNEDLQKAWRDYAAANNYKPTFNDFINDQYRNATDADVLNAQLRAWGLDDYTTDKAHYGMGGNVIPGGAADKYGYESGVDPNIIVNGQPQQGNYWTYGGQTYLTGGEAGLMSQYALAKSGQLTNADYLMGHLLENPFIMNDSKLYSEIQRNMANYNLGTPAGGTGAGAAGSGNMGTTINTGNTNIDSTINYINSAMGYAQQTGNTALMAQIENLFKGGLDNMQAWLAEQKAAAKQESTDQARAAWVNKEQSNNALKETLSSSGLGTSGAMQSGMLGINNTYGNNLADINANLSKMLTNLNEQELQAIADYYNKMGDYYFRANENQADRDLSYAKMAQDAQQWQQDYILKQQAQANLIKQQELENQRYDREYADEQAQQQIKNAQAADTLASKQLLQQASDLATLLGKGKITYQQYQQGLAELGLA